MACLALASTIACVETGGNWENPNLPAEQWKQDTAQCHRLARDQAERDYALAREESPVITGDRLQPYVTSMDRFSAERRERTLFDQCMAARGYQRIQPAEPDKTPAK